MGARTDNGECGPGWHAAAQAFIGGQGRGPVLSAPMHGNGIAGEGAREGGEGDGGSDGEDEEGCYEECGGGCSRRATRAG